VNSIHVVEKKLGRHDSPTHKILGLAYKEDLRIEIDPRQSSKEYLDTLVHETMHIIFPKESEKRVTAAAKKIARILWNKGFRRTI